MNMYRRKFLKLGVIGLIGLCPKKILSLENLLVDIEDPKLRFDKKLNTGWSPKSIEFSQDMKKGYVNNLEECTTWVIDAESHSIEKVISYKKTPIVVTDSSGTYDSFEEKRVETCFTHNGERLWTSLHNAQGVTVQYTKGNLLNMDYETKRKKVIIKDMMKGEMKKTTIPFIKTGMTPKVVCSTYNNERVCVANWNSSSVSVIDSETGKKYGDIKVGSAPRGIAFTRDSKIGFVANFSSRSISIFDVYNVEKISDMENIGKNPRHILIDPNYNYLYVSFHGDGYLRRFDISKRKLKDELYVGGQLRSIVATPDFKYLFVDSFNNNQTILINTDSMKIKQRVTSAYHPVGIAYNNLTKEVWVVNQGNSTLSIFDFY